MDTPQLQHVVLVFESRARWVEGRVKNGWDEDDARIASYWLFADSDVPALAKAIREEAPQLKVHIFEIDQVEEMLEWLDTVDRASVILWNVSDGLRRFRGALIPGLARLVGVAYFGNPVRAQALGQDKFKLSAVARESGVRVPRGFLARGNRVVSAPHTVFDTPRYFVKTNSYGNKVGLGANAIAADIPSALAVSAKIEARFKDECIVQEYLPGMELRATCLRGWNGMKFSLCRVDFFDRAGTMLPHYRISADGYVGDDYFTPIESIDGLPAAEVRRLYREIGASIDLLTSALGLRDYWAMDFRLDAEGSPHLIDLNTGAFPSGEAFEYHARVGHSASFGQVLSRALHISHEATLKQPPEE